MQLSRIDKASEGLRICYAEKVQLFGIKIKGICTATTYSVL